MSTQTLHPLAAEYLDGLRRAGKRLPRGRRQELLTEIEAHLHEAIAPEATDAEALTVLDRLGGPEEIIEAEQPVRMAPVDPRGPREWAAIFLLLFGGLIAGIGWIAGLVLLWSSRAWSTRDKWIGTLIVPGGLITPVLLVGLGAGEVRGSGKGDSGYLAIIVLAVLLLAPLATAVYLVQRADQR